MMRNLTCLYCLILMLVTSACNKKGTNSTIDRSYISVINASPSLATYNFYLNNAKVNTAALPMGGSINYLEIPSGSHTTKFTIASSTESLFGETISLNSGAIYSYFFLGHNGQHSVVMSTDELSAGGDQASVRLANMSPDAPALDLVATTTILTDTDKTVTSGLSYKTVGAFSTLEPKAYTFHLKDKTTGNILATSEKVTLAAGKYYTLLVRGMVNPQTGLNPIGLQVITNL